MELESWWVLCIYEFTETNLYSSSISMELFYVHVIWFYISGNWAEKWLGLLLHRKKVQGLNLEADYGLSLWSSSFLPKSCRFGLIGYSKSRSLTNIANFYKYCRLLNGYIYQGNPLTLSGEQWNN